MRAVSLGKVVVATAGTPVQLGVSKLGANMAAGDQVFTISNAGVFSPDMLPFHIDIGVGAAREGMMVTAIAGTTFSVAPRANPQAHSTNDLVQADFKIAGFIASASDANTGKVYLGTRSMATGGSAGTIKKFSVTTGAVPDDTLNVMLNSQDGDPGQLTDYKVDVAVSAEGLYFACWVR